MSQVSNSLNLNIELYSHQSVFLRAPERFTMFVGGIGSGKTTAGAVKALVQSAARPGSLGVVVAPTYPMLRDSTLRTLQDILGKTILHYNKSDGELTLINGSQILLRSADKPDRLRGPNAHWAWIDEAALCPPGTWEIIIGRLRADGTAGPCWLTSTPKGHNWMYQKRGLMRLFKASTRHNPYLNPEFVQSLIDSYSGDFASQEIDAEFVRFEGQIYDEFEYARHVRENKTELKRRNWVEFWGAGDEGYINPQCYLIMGLDDDGGVHVFEEFYKRKVRTTVAAREAKLIGWEWAAAGRPIEIFYIDPSAASLAAEIAEEEPHPYAGDDGVADDALLPGIPTRSARNAVLPGIQTVKAYLAGQNKYGPMLTISPECPFLLGEIDQYAWKDWKEGRKEEPVKMNDHAMDTLRYGIYSHLGGLQGSIMARGDEEDEQTQQAA